MLTCCIVSHTFGKIVIYEPLNAHDSWIQLRNIDLFMPDEINSNGLSRSHVVCNTKLNNSIQITMVFEFKLCYQSHPNHAKFTWQANHRTVMEKELKYSSHVYYHHHHHRICIYIWTYFLITLNPNVRCDKIMFIKFTAIFS